MIRICDTCGKAFYEGMTNDCGDFYAHEGKCFNKYMNKTYGKHEWMALGNGAEDGEGGYYIAAGCTPSGIEPTGIYYTTYYLNDEYNGKITYECKTKTETFVFDYLDDAIDFVKETMFTDTIDMYEELDGEKELIDSATI